MWLIHQPPFKKYLIPILTTKIAGFSHASPKSSRYDIKVPINVSFLGQTTRVDKLLRAALKATVHINDNGIRNKLNDIAGVHNGKVGTLNSTDVKFGLFIRSTIAKCNIFRKTAAK